MKIRVEMIGGPLDGGVMYHEVISGQFLDTYWIGPDPADAASRVIVYELTPGAPDQQRRKRMFNQEITNVENLKRDTPS